MTKLLNVLVIEDSNADFLLLKRELTKLGIEKITRVQTMDLLCKAMDDEWDLIISDYSIPKLRFEESLAVIQSRLSEVPVILVSGTVGEEMAVDLLKLGVWDFVLKDNLSRLALVINRCHREVEERKARKAAEQELIHNEQRLRLALNASKMGVWEWDIRKNNVFWSAECFQIIGKLNCSGNFRECVNRAYPLDAEFIQTIIDRSLKEMSPFNIECRIITENQEERWIVFGGQPYCDDSGELPYMVGTVQDITERKRIEQDLRIASVVFEASDGMVVTDSDGIVLRVNSSFSLMTGLTSDEALGYGLNELLVSQRNSIEFQDAMWKKLKATGYWHGEFWLNKLSGEDFLCVASFTAVHNEEGSVVHYVGIYRDVSETRKQQEMLLQAQKMEAIGQLTGGLAHDFNNLLGIVIGNLDLLSVIVTDQEQQKLLETAQRAALRGAEISKSLLAVSRRQPLSFTTVNVSELVQGLLPLIRNSVGARIEIEQNIETKEIAVSVDVNGLESAILNLVINARDAMPNGGKLFVAVSSTYTNGDAVELGLRSGHYAVIDITDTGCGMSESVRLKATEPFFTTKERGRGTGLGLAIVSGFAKQSGGALHIYSEVGKGSNFRIYLPVTQFAESVNNEIVEKIPKGFGAILVVDDELDLLELAMKWLQDLGYKVETEPNPANALERVKQGHYDLLFTDIVMPGKIDGIALAAEVRKIRPDMRILFTSGFAEPLLSEPDSLFAPLLQKPYLRSELAQAVNKVMTEAK